MWLALNDAFLSIVQKDCPVGSLLVRARRPGDIEKVFGRRTKVVRSTDSDYLYRAVIAKEDVVRAMQDEVLRVTYPNFKDSVADEDLHDAYLKVWGAMAALQSPRPYSSGYAGKWMGSTLPGEVPKYDLVAQVEKLGADSLLPKANLTAPKSGAVSKKNSKQKRKAARLIRKNGASIGTEPKEK